MTVRRGEVILTRGPHAAGGRGKKRPAVVVQADGYNQTERFVIVTEVTSNLARATDPAHLLIEVATPDGAATGLARDSVVTCMQLATVSMDRVDRVIGRLSPALMTRLDACLKASLGI
ncbi:MAG: transcriptional modulator of MazE/toxin, MazF [Gemmataceae bacterium]|nr:transcriptional modulator of MazE/toxin, MazF [Gemmataceae bacterium]